MVSERASKLHYSSIIVDTHSDSIDRAVDRGEDLGRETGQGFMDLPRMRRGNLTAQFFACFVDPKYIAERKSIQRVLDMADAVKQLCAQNPLEIGLARTASDVRRLSAEGKRSAILCVEGGHAIEDDLAVLRQFHELGVRYMTLTWHNTNNWADGILDEARHNGLTDFGREVVREMNRLGMMVDVSHASIKTFWDAIEATSRPIIASHSSCWSICQHPRNMNDDQLRAMARNGGVVCVCFINPHISESYRQHLDSLDQRKMQELRGLEERFSPGSAALDTAVKDLGTRYEEVTKSEIVLPNYTEIVDHIEHIIQVAGVDHVGLGADLNFSSIPRGMEDCTKYPWITEELVRRGYSDEEIKKVLGENVLRLMEEVIGQ